RHVHHVLAVQLRRYIGTPQTGGDFLLDELGLALLENQDGFFGPGKFNQLLGHQRVHHVEREDRNARGAERIGEPQGFQREHQAVVQAALDDDADRVFASGKYLVQLVLANELARRRQAHVRLQLLLAERRRWMGEAVVNEFLRRSVDLLARRYCRLLIVLRDEASLDVARAASQLDPPRRVPRFAQPD